MQKYFNQSAQFIKSFVRYTWFKSPIIYKTLPILDYAYPILISPFHLILWENEEKNIYVHS